MTNSGNKTNSSKIFTALFILILIYSFIAGFLELPPAALLIRYYCQLFDTNKYPVALIALVLCFIGLVPLVLVKKIMDHKRRS